MPAATPFERVAGPLRLRRPTEADLPSYLLLHSDPRTYSHAPETMPDAQRCRERLEEDLRHWSEHGFGYAAVEEVATGRVVGWGGVRSYPHHEQLNLYYRFAYDVLARGYGRTLARAVTVDATEFLPGRPVHAAMRPVNERSLRTAESAGMVRVGTVPPNAREAPGSPDSLLLELPQVVALRDPAQLHDTRDALLDLWVRVVNEGGGAVGFLPGVEKAAVADLLAEHEAAMAAGRSVMGLLLAPQPDGEPETTVGTRLLGFAWWEGSADARYRHVAKLWRLQVTPAYQGRNLGAVLLAGMHAIARALPGVELLKLDYRSGTGTGAFYARAGWVETGRQPGALRVAPGDDRDDVQMVRRVDGGELVYDGRL